MGLQHKCELDIREKKEVLEQLKEIVALMSSCKKKLKTGPSPDNVPLCMTRRLPRFQKNYDLIPLVTSVPVLEIRPTSNQKVLRSEKENPNVAYIKIEVDGNPFRTDWDDMREARRTVCPKHDVKYGAHVHEDVETQSEPNCGPYSCGVSKDSSESSKTNKICDRCNKIVLDPAEMLANVSNLNTVCLCEALDCYFQKVGLHERPITRTLPKVKKDKRRKEICFCNPKNDQKVSYLCDCKPPTKCLPLTYK